jgi:HAD superfamily hydrolase (TIGR01509 family)
MSAPAVGSLRALVFDFDHTLTDLGRWVDWQGARDAIARLYAEAGADVTRVRARGMALMSTLRDALVAKGHDVAFADRLFARSFEILEEHEAAGAARAGLLPGAAAVLDLAAARGLALGIVSANAESAIRSALQRLGIEDRFGVVIGRSLRHPPKPEPAMHVEAARVLGCRPAEALGIGDSVNDVHAAVGAGMLAVGVIGGESSPDDLLAAGASWVLADLTVLPALLALWESSAE